jgi:undecaprenyl diphosphate synthase
LKRAVSPPVAPNGAASVRNPDVPRHVAIVMDGNGRWARKRFMPRIYGHKHGVDSLVNAIQACANRGVEHLTVFAFSSENWKRPEEEVSGLMGLVLSAMTRYLTKIAGDGVRVRIIGDRAAVSESVRNAWERAEKTTEHNERITVWVAFNYGGRWDVVQACRRAVAEGLDPSQITEEKLSSYMAQREAPDPDLFIRTGGEVRISNFLLWQVAYSELYFTDCLWPDFDDRELDKAFAAYAGRDRRFGGVKNEAAAPPGGADAA